MNEPRMTGRVISWSANFGFLKPDAGGPDLFVNPDETNRRSLASVDLGAKVSFVAQPDRHGRPRRRAIDLKLEGGPNGR